MSTFYRLSAAGLIVGLLAAAPAFAAGDQGPSVTVRFADLDISRPDDARELLSRIERGAKRVCQSNGIAGYPTYRTAVRQCIGEAVERAVEGVGSPQLSAVYRGDGREVASR
jgi:UrcA family protein